MSEIMLASSELALKKRVTHVLKELNLELKLFTSTSEDTLIEFQKLRPSILILDQLLPGPHGIELLKKLCAMSEDTAIIMIARIHHSSIVEKLFRNGAKDVLMHPFQDDTLATTLLHRLTEEN